MTTLMQHAAALADLGHEMRENSRRAATTAARITSFLETRHDCANLCAELSAPDAPIGWPEHTEVFKEFRDLYQVAGEAALRKWYSDYYLFFDGICDTCGRESCANTQTLSQCCHAPLRRLDGGIVVEIDIEGAPF